VTIASDTADGTAHRDRRGGGRRRRLGAAAFVIAGLLAWTCRPAFARGECGLSCCIGSAGPSGVTLAQNFGLSVQYEYMKMGTIKHGTSSVGPNEALDELRSPGKPYAVPLDMTMQKISLIGAYTITERWQILGILPYVINDMDMRMRVPTSMHMARSGASPAMDMDGFMDMDHSMDRVDGVGDFALLAFYNAFTDAPIRPTQRLTLGVGLQTPTGRNEVKTPSGNFVHAMMQPGTGSWDPLFLVNYMRAFYPLVLQANFFYHLTTEGDTGYEFGDQLAFDLIARYQVWDYVNLGFETNFIYAGRDTDHDRRYSHPETSMVDNPANTGITTLALAPSVQVKLPRTGGSLDFKYQVPVFQDANGYQLVLDWRILAGVVWNF
jgi:hypothetical protein